jgi:hypothetical protein
MSALQQLLQDVRTGRDKENSLKKIEKLLLSDQVLLNANLEIVLETFNLDKDPLTRRFALELVSSLLKMNPQYCRQIVDTLLALASDDSQKLKKPLIVTTNLFFKNYLHLLCGTQSSEFAKKWSTVKTVRDKILASMRTCNNDGIRLYCIHFLETIILAYSFPSRDPIQVAHKKGTSSTRDQTDPLDFDLSMIPMGNQFLDAKALSTEGETNLKKLIAWAGDEKTNPIPLGLVLQVLFNITKQRDVYWPYSIPALCDFSTKISTRYTESEVTSLKWIAKKILLYVLRMPATVSYRKKIETALTVLEVKEDVIKNHIEQADRAQPKKTREEKFVPEKRVKLEDVYSEVYEENFLYATPVGRLSSIQMTNAVVEYLAKNNVTTIKGPPIPVNFNTIGGIVMQMFSGIRDTDRLFAQSFISHTEPYEIVREIKMEQYREEDISEEEMNKFIQEFSQKTKILTLEQKSDLLLSRLKKMLENEAGLERENSIDARNQLVCRFVSNQEENSPYWKELFNYVTFDLAKRFNLLVQWLYQEFTNQTLKSTQNRYENLLESILDFVQHKYVGHQTIFTRLLIEAPKLTRNCLEKIQEYIQEPTKTFAGLLSLKELILTREKTRSTCLEQLLGFCFHLDEKIRVFSIDLIVNEIYKQSNVVMIQDYAFSKFQEITKVEEPRDVMDVVKTEDVVEITGWDTVNTRLCITLFLRLCAQEPSLISRVIPVYAKIAHVPLANEPKKSFLVEFNLMVRKLGPDSKHLLVFLEVFPPEVEDLAMAIVQAVVEGKAGQTPSNEFLALVKNTYKKYNSAKFLIPMLRFLKREEVLESLKDLILLNEKLVKFALERIISYRNTSTSLSPSSLLSALFDLDSKYENLQKQIWDAMEVCLSNVQVFSRKVLEPILNDLVEMKVLPSLLMQTLIQVVGISEGEVMVAGIMLKLSKKKIWLHASLWEGFVKCLKMDQMKNERYNVLVSLPATQIRKIFEQDKSLIEGFKQYVETNNIKSKEITSLLEIQ